MSIDPLVTPKVSRCFSIANDSSVGFGIPRSSVLAVAAVAEPLPLFGLLKYFEYYPQRPMVCIGHQRTNVSRAKRSCFNYLSFLLTLPQSNFLCLVRTSSTVSIVLVRTLSNARSRLFRSSCSFLSVVFTFSPDVVTTLGAD